MLVEVDPLETASDKDLEGRSGARWYEDRMRRNLKNLAGALP